MLFLATRIRIYICIYAYGECSDACCCSTVVAAAHAQARQILVTYIFLKVSTVLRYSMLINDVVVRIPRSEAAKSFKWLLNNSIWSRMP